MKNKFLKISAVTLFWLTVWQLISLKINEEILMVSPFVTFKRVIEILLEKETYGYILRSFYKVFLGFSIGFIVGSLLAILSYVSNFIKELFYPFIILLKSVPIVAFIILILVWFKAANIGVFVSSIMVIPIIYSNIYEGLLSTDIKMLEMADIFKLSFLKKIKFIYLPHISSFILAGLTTSIGISWKSGLTAEVIGLPPKTIGEQIYNSKIYLDTETLFAYIVIIVFISILSEKILCRVFEKFILKRYLDD